MYGDGLHIFGAEVAPKAIDTAAADFADYDLAFPISILAVGVAVVTDFGDAVTAGLIASVDYKIKGGARTELLTIPVDAASIKRGDGSRAGQTAIANYTDLDDGDVVLYKTTALPFKLPAGATLYLEHKVAATGGTPAGTYNLIVLARIEGFDTQSANILVPAEPAP